MRSESSTRARSRACAGACVLLAVLMAFCPSLAYAKQEMFVPRSEFGCFAYNEVDGTVYAAMANSSKYKAAIALIDEDIDEPTPIDRSWLVSPTHGGRFYALAQKIHKYDYNDRSEYYDPSFIQAGSVVYGLDIWSCAVSPSLIAGAKEDYRKILNGDFDPTANPEESTYDILTFRGTITDTPNVTGTSNTTVPQQYILTEGGSGDKLTNYLYRQSSGEEYKGTDNLLEEDFTITVKNSTSVKWTKDKKYSIVLWNYTTNTGNIHIEIIGIPEDKEFTYTNHKNKYNNYTGTSYDTLKADNTGYKCWTLLDTDISGKSVSYTNDYLCNKRSMTLEMKNANISEGSYYYQGHVSGRKIWMVLPQGDITPIDPPDYDPEDWPEPTPDPPKDPTPDPPTPQPNPDPDPLPDPPEDPVYPSPEPPDPGPITNPIVNPTPDVDPPTEYTDYTPWLRAILAQLAVIHSDMLVGVNSLITAINSVNSMLSRINSSLATHCDHIRDCITDNVEAVNDSNNYLFRWAFGENGRMHKYVYHLENYMKELAEWLASQLSFNYTGGDVNVPAYDDSSVVGWLKKIWAKLGGTTVVTKPVDPAPDPDPWWDWLNKVINSFLSGLGDILGDLGSGLGTFADFLEHTFPFSIPWDIAALLAMLVAEPVTPSLTITIPAIQGWWDAFDFDLNLAPYDTMMATVRQMELFCFVGYLAMKTPDLLRDVDVAGYLRGD